ncbi:Deoxyhypusine hydroxylase [Plasmodiophora brassicae]
MDAASMITRNDLPIAQRMRAVFELKQLATEAAVDAICDGIRDESVLLAHECCYGLGQLRNPRALPALRNALSDTSLHPVVRHEAAEAIGAIGDPSDRDFIAQFVDDPAVEVSETCRIALDLFAERDANQSSTSCSGRFQSVDPAPPAAAQPDVGASERVRRWSEELLDTRLPLFERYKAMFALRDDGSPAAVAALCKSFADRSSALFRHEVAYVLGQLQDPLSRDALLAVLQDSSEHEMVRHEAAEALGAIADSDALGILRTHLDDSDQIVKQSCEVALDLYEYWNADRETAA